MSDFIEYCDNFNMSCFNTDKKELFILSHQNIINDIYGLLTSNLINQYQKLKRLLVLNVVKDYQEKYKVPHEEIEFFYSDIIEELKEGKKLKKPNKKLLTNSVNIYKTLLEIVEQYFIGSGLIENIENEEYIVIYYNTSYVFDNEKINKKPDYVDYRFNKHIEFIKLSRFIRILMENYTFKFKDIN